MSTWQPRLYLWLPRRDRWLVLCLHSNPQNSSVTSPRTAKKCHRLVLVDRDQLKQDTNAGSVDRTVREVGTMAGYKIWGFDVRREIVSRKSFVFVFAWKRSVFHIVLADCWGSCSRVLQDSIVETRTVISSKCCASNGVCIHSMLRVVLERRPPASLQLFVPRARSCWLDLGTGAPGVCRNRSSTA